MKLMNVKNCIRQMFFYKYYKKLRTVMSLRKQWRKMWIDNFFHSDFAQVGEHCQVMPNSSLVPNNIYMEDYSRIQGLCNMISYKGKLIVKKYAAIASGVTIIPSSHTPTVGLPQFLSSTHINDKDETIVVNEDAWVGAGSILLSHCVVGRGAVVAAGAVVSKEVPPYAVVAGIPAKIIASRFTIDQILEHEKILYPPEERMQYDVLKKLFEENFQNKKCIGISYISNEDELRLRKEKEKLGIADYRSVI